MDPPRPSAIPRPPPTSRLPVLRPSASHSQLPSPASTTQLRKKPSLASISRPPPQSAHTHALPRAAPPPPPQPQPTVQRKSSRVSLVPSYNPSPTANAPLARKPSRAALVPSTGRRVSSIPTGGPPKKSFARPPSRQPTTPSLSLRTPTTPNHDDLLASLDGFRSSSRASSRAASRAASRVALHESSSSPEYVPNEGEKKKSRPSLSERTMESLAHLPSSPANAKRTRRRSSFFAHDNTMAPPLRPASAMSNKTNPSRPATSDGTASPLPTTPSKPMPPSSRISMTVPAKRTVSAAATTPSRMSTTPISSTPISSTTPSRISSISRPTTAVKKPPLLPTHNMHTPSKKPTLVPTQNMHTPSKRALSESRNTPSRTPKPRPSPAAVNPTSPPPPTASARKPPTSSLTLRNSIAQAKLARKEGAVESHGTPTNLARKEEAIESPNATPTNLARKYEPFEPPNPTNLARKYEPFESPNPTPTKTGTSSSLLREQIAKARQAAKRNKAGPIRADTPPKDAIIPDPDEVAGFDFGLGDPFNQNSKGAHSVLRKRVDGARSTGRLNIAGMQLTEMPDEVLHMYNPSDTTVAWGEIVDVTTILAADNELDTLPDSMFPDVDISHIDDDEPGPQFGGVQTLDFHGNLLRELPMGLRRLAELTKLNLSRNKLAVDALHVITQIASLRELRLAENNLAGDLSPSVANLAQLQVLDLANNNLISLPAELRELTQLRTLNVADNQLTTVPMDLFSTSLTDFTATRNRLEGTFFTIHSAPHLQELRLSGNALASLADSHLDLPLLKHLDMSANRLSSLPEVTAWSSLGTLLLAENKIAAFPDGFFSLKQLRIADFTANGISRVDERIALMQGLDNLILAANPIRERKFLTMSTDDMKRDLHARLQLDEVVTGADEEVDFSNDELASESSEAPNGWTVTPSGTLDLTSKSFTELDDDALIALAETNDIRQINLQNNLLQTIPLALAHMAFLTILDLSKNSISNPLTSPLSLPKLRELRLSGNKLTSLTSLTTHLTAPSLQTLDISQNRLTGSLPALHAPFPALATLLASDNALVDVPAPSLSALKTVNLANNNMDRLDPRIGLLAGTLTSLILDGNRFRVPNYQVLNKGTDALLAWLADKVPREQGRARGDSAASDVTRTTEEGSEFFDAEDGV